METSGPAPTIVVIMGVSASGKTTLGRLLAGRRDVPFVEGDDFHPAANIAKMAAGHALDDEDREPWLRSLAEWIRGTTRARVGAVISCSALKREYRDALRAAGPGVWFLYLSLDREVARTRITRRAGHFMPAGLLESQYDALEPLQADEPGLTVDADADTDAVLGQVHSAIAHFEAPNQA
ncbi:gluconokinase [Kitasatospora sp. Root107]|uniref:gluconokinase n=1 Tax=Kitasatospora sp. Root107 TaxID=1736424 RepID=UPI000B31ADFB|nr:gluconokinase [Kitasatospora sp. Root107]